MAEKLPPKTVFITGASSGIGEACAIRLDKEGFHVFAGIFPDESDGAKLKGKTSERLTPVLIDVTDAQSISSARETVARSVGASGLSGLVNCAGVPGIGPIEFFPIDAAKRVFDVNFFGAMAVTQTFLPMLRSTTGRIVNISSDGGLISFPFGGPYCFSKFALEAFSDSLRVELKPWEISVSVVEPGNVQTNIWGRASAEVGNQAKQLPAEAYEMYRAAYDHWSGLKVQGIPPDRVAKAVLHALTAKRPKTRYVVGPDARVVSFVARLPDRIRDKIALRIVLSYEKGDEK
jgi:NAD(P)-dependent dehydrogenase (short-subunit alcohol dehydrogenase family)